MEAQTRSIGEIILQMTNVTEEQLAEALRRRETSDQPVGQILVQMGAISEKELVRCLGRHWDIPFIDLEEIELDPALLSQFPGHIMRQYNVVPVKAEGGQIQLAMENPLDIFTIDEIQLATGKKNFPCIPGGQDIRNTLHRHGDQSGSARQAMEAILSELGGDMGAEAIELREEEEEPDAEGLLSMLEQAPVVRLVNMIIQEGVTERASDIHIQPELSGKAKVRYRIDGRLREGRITVPKELVPPLIVRLKVMSDKDISERRKPQDGRISMRIAGKDYDFRVSFLPGVYGEKVVLRILDKSGVQIGLESLGFHEDTLTILRDVIQRTYGVILVSGPTGSGKSTTLYSVLHELNDPEVNILTVEDPVEYQLEGLTQVQVNPKADLTFAGALRSFLRQDPDIIMVGEIRDGETALIATEAALTGHLVLSTIHTNDAPSAATRLNEMKIEPFLIASSLVAVLAQRLVRKVCSKCAEEFVPPTKALRRLGLGAEQCEDAVFMRGRGCPVCRGSGYKGRSGVFELMNVSDSIRTAILAEEAAYTIRERARSEGMKSLLEDGLDKVLAGVTTPEALLSVVNAASE